ncbi:MAG TPA: Asp23/Gls24 family envelope stress response protein, partial [Chlamydiales bacterium]|nr:Asp23/Gls24 family envelope stress response protein [Chlamydiales bacterium]
MHDQFERMDAKELDFPDTVFVHDVESRVFQAITVQALAEIEGIGLIEGNLFDNLLGREGHERIKGIHVEQDQKNHSLSVKLEINVAYGVHLPLKAQEI